MDNKFFIKMENRIITDQIIALYEAWNNNLLSNEDFIEKVSKLKEQSK